ncbi:unnamed protein product [Pleuronectes platessa]|uniref:Uncharacterized protein n=1 Tax=Pleuronectes platessa TaxID=8262 RepID=A0A9N7TUF0_PLEPL|nr:unnamed protein product [Pleuronectes platessa]
MISVVSSTPLCHTLDHLRSALFSNALRLFPPHGVAWLSTPLCEGLSGDVDTGRRQRRTRASSSSREKPPGGSGASWAGVCSEFVARHWMMGLRVHGDTGGWMVEINAVMIHSWRRAEGGKECGGGAEGKKREIAGEGIEGVLLHRHNLDLQPAGGAYVWLLLLLLLLLHFA